MRMCIYDSMQTLYFKDEIVAHAVHDSLCACMDIQINAIKKFKPDIVVGSSWGGAVLVFLLLNGHWNGPTMLISSAHRRVLHLMMGLWTGKTVIPEIDSLLVIHGEKDETVPVQDSRLLAATAKSHRTFRYLEIQGADHRLNKNIVDTKALQQYVREVWALAEKNK